MANSEPFNQRKIKLPLAVDTGGARKKTQDIYLAFYRFQPAGPGLIPDGSLSHPTATSRHCVLNWNEKPTKVCLFIVTISFV